MLFICWARFVKGGDEIYQLITSEARTINLCTAISNQLHTFLMTCLADHIAQFHINPKEFNSP